MSFLSQLSDGRLAKARRTLLFAVPGFGKSTWGAGWDRPILLPTEDGSADIDCTRGPLITTYEDALSAASEIARNAESLPYRTVVIDTADWLERLAHRRVVDGQAGATSITDGKLAYGVGYGRSEILLNMFLDKMNVLRANDIHVVFLAHCSVKSVKPPDNDAYDQYVPKMQKGFSAIIEEWADEVLFGTFRVYTVEKEQGFGGEKRKVGVGSGERVLKTCERPGWKAKNRLGLPEEMSVPELPANPTRQQMRESFAEYNSYLPKFPKKGNVDGAVVNGSSKVPTTDEAQA